MTPFYVYRVECLPTSEYYFGARFKHSVQNLHPEEDLWIRYFTSSRLVADLIRKYGKDAFEPKILFTAKDADECFRHEQSLIEKYISNPLCLNMRYYDVNKHKKVFHVFGRTLPTKGKPKPEKFRQFMRQPKSEEHRRAISEAQKSNGGNGPKKHSEETKKKIAIAGKGKIHSQETKDKIGATHRGKKKPTVKCPNCHLIGSKGPMHRFHFEHCKTLR